MYRIVATDMDETFLAADHSVPAANIDAVLAMRERGVLFVPASGRGYASVMHSLRDMPEACLKDTYVLSYNGSCINRAGDERPLVSHTLPFETVRSIFEWSEGHDVGVHIYELSGKVWGHRITDEEIAYLAGHMDLTLLPEGGLETLSEVPIAKMLVVYPDLDILHALADEMPESARPGTETTFSSGRYLEFNPLGVNKGSGLAALAEMLGVPMDEVIACGDSANDIDMMRAAGLGVAVSNATPDALEAADYVATSSCDDGVFAEVYERFIEG